LSSTVLQNIADFGKELVSETNIDKISELVAQKAREIVPSERCSVFMLDAEADMLWSRHADGLGRIAIAKDSGIVGESFLQAKSDIVNHPYNDSRFMANIDKKSGFTTKNLITVPVFNSDREVIAVIELLNKIDGEYNVMDQKNLTLLANYISGTIEIALDSEKQ